MLANTKSATYSDFMRENPRYYYTFLDIPEKWNTLPEKYKIAALCKAFFAKHSGTLRTPDGITTIKRTMVTLWISRRF